MKHFLTKKDYLYYWSTRVQKLWANKQSSVRNLNMFMHRLPVIIMVIIFRNLL